MLSLDDIEQVKDDLFKFVWNFRHGDNIVYNFRILRSLYRAKAGDPEPRLLNKPITIAIVSIVEAILIDFLSRIDEGTAHLPAGIEPDVLNDMKAEIMTKKKRVKLEDDELGERIFLKRKMYNYGDIVKIFRKYQVFGVSTDTMYDQLQTFGDLRNRVYIENYHRNFEDRENHVYTEERLRQLEEVLRQLWLKMTVEFKRPWSELA